MFSKQIKHLRMEINQAHDLNCDNTAAVLQRELHSIFLANANNANQEARDSNFCLRLARIQTHGSQQAREHYRSVLAFS